MSDYELPAEIRQEDSDGTGILEQFNSADVIEAMRTDMDFFAGVVLPEDCTLEFPGFYRWLWAQLCGVLDKTRDFSKYAIGLPRGHGKTQVIKLLIVYAILFTSKRYILIIGSTVAKAKAILSDVADMMDGGNIQTIFGQWRFQMDSCTQEKIVFTFQGRKIILEAAGQGTAIRGSNQGNSRPDLMIFDDAQTKECAESSTEAVAFQKWFVGTALKAKSPKSCTFIYIGNMYKDLELIKGQGVYGCMLRNLQKSKAWVTFIIGAILADGTALWEELQPLQQLLEEYAGDVELGQEDIFIAEVLNNPSGGKSYYIDTEKIVCQRDTFGIPHQGSFIIIDPATSKATVDKMVVNYFEMYDNRPVSIELLAEKFTAPESVSKSLELAFRRGCRLIIVESNAYQSTLCEWFRFVLEQRGIFGIEIVEMHTSKQKTGKILRLFKSLMADEIRTSPDTDAALKFQAVAFDPTKTNNEDDILDSFAMAHQAAIEFRTLMVSDADLYNNIITSHLADHRSGLPELPNTLF